MTRGTETCLPNCPEIFVVGNTIDPPVTFSPSTEHDELEWHADHMHLEVPARASLLYARAVPQQGGDTLFACMYTAYDTLSPEQQAAYDELRVMHSLSGLRTYLQQQHHTEAAPAAPGAARSRGGAPAGASPPALRPQGALLWESGEYWYCRLAGGQGAWVYSTVDDTRLPTGLPVSPPLAGRRCRALGQPPRPTRRNIL